MRTILLVLLALSGVVVATVLFGRAHWISKTNALLARLEAARAPMQAVRFDAKELDGLPEPVRRYFRFALVTGQPVIMAASIKQRGTINLDLSKDRWVPFKADQHVAIRRPGFVWDARTAMAPGLYIHVHDAYVAGEGVLNPSMLGLFDIQNLRGSGDIAQGELMRFLAEAPLYPTALLPSQGIVWTAIDDSAAQATLKDGALSVTLAFRFLPDGAIASVRAEARGFAQGEKTVMRPWEGRWTDYQERGGMRIPLTGEVAWILPEGRRPYWRGTMSDIRYTYAQSAQP